MTARSTNKKPHAIAFASHIPFMNFLIESHFLSFHRYSHFHGTRFIVRLVFRLHCGSSKYLHLCNDNCLVIRYYFKRSDAHRMQHIETAEWKLLRSTHKRHSITIAMIARPMVNSTSFISHFFTYQQFEKKFTVIK